MSGKKTQHTGTPDGYGSAEDAERDASAERAMNTATVAHFPESQFAAAWSQTVDAYITAADRAWAHSLHFKKKVTNAALNSPFVQLDSRTLFKVTLFALLVVFATVLFSCRSMPGLAKRTRKDIPTRNVEKKPETLYLKRDTLNIKPANPGSNTGSLWADAQTPRGFFAEVRPSKPGDVVTVSIPEDLQFKWKPPLQSSGTGKASAKGDKPASTGAKGGAGSTTAAGSGAKGPAGLDGSGADLNLQDPSQVGLMADMGFEPVKSMKMAIIGIEAGGDVILRGTKEYGNNLGERRNVMVLAKLPRRMLTSFEVDARELTEVELSEETNGQTSAYRATGWDMALSRKLSGFVPDITAELASLDDVRKDMAVSQNALRDQAKALADERDRMRKERERAALLEQRNTALKADAATKEQAEAQKPMETDKKRSAPK